MPSPDDQDRMSPAEERRVGAAIAESQRQAEKMQQPSVGRVVHYFTDGHFAPSAAIITAVHPGNHVSLHVMPAPATELTPAHIASVAFEVYGVPHRDDAKTSSSPFWAWPARA